MKDFLKAVLYNPKLWRVLLISILTFLGYNEAVRYIDSGQDVPTEPVIIKEPVEVKTRYVPVQHDHIDWLPIMRLELEKARDEHNDNHHGGS